MCGNRDVGTRRRRGLRLGSGDVPSHRRAEFGDDAEPAKSVWAIAVAGIGERGIGSELELSYVPQFFEKSSPKGAGKVVTLMANLSVVIPAGAFRPYGTIGYGFIRERTETSEGGFLSDLSSKDLGYNMGGGFILRLARSVGIRGDFRRFTVRHPEGVRFNRVTGGIVLGGG